MNRTQDSVMQSHQSRSLDTSGSLGRSRDVTFPQSVADDLIKPGRPRSALAPIQGTPNNSMNRSTMSAASKKKNKVTTYNETADNVEKEYIRNLQQQIYFLELESKFLRENKVSVGEIGGEKIEAGSVEEFLKQLKQKYNQMEIKYQDEIENIKEERNKFEEKCYMNEQELKQLRMDVDQLNSNMDQVKEHDGRIAAELRTEVVNLRKAVAARDDMIRNLTSERDEAYEDKENIVRKHVSENLDAIRLKEQLEEAVAIRKQAESEMERERSNKIRVEATCEMQEDRLRQLEVAYNGLKVDAQTSQRDKRTAELALKQMTAEHGFLKEHKDKLEKDLHEKTKEAHDWESKVQLLSKEEERAKQLGGARVFERVIYRYMLGFMKGKVRSAEDKRDKSKKELDEERAESLMMKTEYGSLSNKLALEKRRMEQQLEKFMELDQIHTSLEQNTSVLKDEIDSLKVSLRDKEEVLQEALHRNYELEAVTNRQKHQLEMQKRVQDLSGRAEEFQQLMETNLRVAKDIESLMELGLVDTSKFNATLEGTKMGMQNETFGNMEAMRRKFYDSKSQDGGSVVRAGTKTPGM